MKPGITSNTFLHFSSNSACTEGCLLCCFERGPMDMVLVRRRRRATFSYIFRIQNQCHIKKLYAIQEVNGIIEKKNICFIAIIASETPRAPLESPELRELPKLLPETSQRPPSCHFPGPDYEAKITRPRLGIPDYECHASKPCKLNKHCLGVSRCCYRISVLFNELTFV